MYEATPRDHVNEREALTLNPIKTCQPVGAAYAALGVHGTMPHSHGSQGCCAFHRMFLTRHFKEPAMVSTSAFAEGASVFGGGSNLKTAVRNIFDMYEPEMIAIHTTCLSETIGDDLHALTEAMDIPEGKRVIYCNTPSYQGSHMTGFASQCAAFITHIAQKTGTPNGKLTVFPGWQNPADMREVKRIVEAFGIDYVMLPDTSGIMDSPMTGEFKLYPDGGTRIEDIVSVGDSAHTIALGTFASKAGANELKRKCDVDYDLLNVPMGIRETDRFVMALKEFSGKDVPYALEEQRGQLVDCLIDCHQYVDGKKVAIAGDPDFLIGLTSFLLEMGMIPKYVFTGTPGKAFEKTINAMIEEAGIEEECVVKAAGDAFEMEQLIIQDPVDLLIGTSHLKYMSRAEGIPLVRLGFPIIDRYFHPYMPLCGYAGGMHIAQKIVDKIMDELDANCADQDIELVM